MSYLKFQVTLVFGGEFCPMLPSRSFVVNATDGDNAIKVAISDATAMGYKRGWIVEQIVEVL